MSEEERLQLLDALELLYLLQKQVLMFSWKVTPVVVVMVDSPPCGPEPLLPELIDHVTLSSFALRLRALVRVLFSAA